MEEDRNQARGCSAGLSAEGCSRNEAEVEAKMEAGSGDGGTGDDGFC